MAQVDVMYMFVSVLDSFEFVLISVSLRQLVVMKRWFINIVVG